MREGNVNIKPESHL